MAGRGGCRCGKLMFAFVNEGRCYWCGHGDVPHPGAAPVGGYRRRRLPWDLGSLLREGRRPDPRCENVLQRASARLRGALA